MRITKGRVAAVVVTVAGIVVGTAGSASAVVAPEPTRQAALPADSVGAAQVKNLSLGVSDMFPGAVTYFRTPGNGTVWQSQIATPVWNLLRTPAAGKTTEGALDPALKAKVNATKGQVTEVEADGPYPGSTKLQDHPGNGANSTEKVPADSKSHAVWVQCADGKTALGGGFRLGADQGDAVAAKIQVTASEPTQIKDGAVVYAPIEGDAAGSVEPNGWLVEVINSGDVDATVRPFVTCAKIAK